MASISILAGLLLQRTCGDAIYDKEGRRAMFPLKRNWWSGNRIGHFLENVFPASSNHINAVGSAADRPDAVLGLETEPWEATKVDLDLSNRALRIWDTDCRPHDFEVPKIRDMYFEPIDAKPDKVELRIWYDSKEETARPDEIYAGTFDRNGPARDDIRRFVHDYRFLK
jgi:hypothetical protein